MNIFKIKREERWFVLVALLLFIFMNGLMVTYQYDLFTRGGRLGFWTIFNDHFHISGFDSYTYLTLSKWNVYYSVFRHPLLAYLWYPLAELNMWLMQEYEFNFAVYFVAAVYAIAASYSCLFMFRIFREVLQLCFWDSVLFVSFFYGFSYIMLSAMAPDHFCLSLFMLTMVIYIAGKKLRDGIRMKVWQTALLFFFTGGVTLSNGIKVWLADVFTNGKKFFTPLHILLVVIMPAALLWGIATYQDVEYVQPHALAGKLIEAQKQKKDPKGFLCMKKKIKKEDHSAKVALAKDGFLQWTNLSTSRSRSVVENLFGESIIFHRQYFIMDIHNGRPVFVKYDSCINYILEAFVVALFLLGCFYGRHSKLMGMLLSWFALDLMIHFGLGFGLNEVYIMGAHWLFIIPIATAFVLKQMQSKYVPYLRGLLGVMTVYLWANNAGLLINFFL